MALKPYKICPWKAVDGAYRVFDRESGTELGSVFKKVHRTHIMTSDHGLNYSIGQRTITRWAFKSLKGGNTWHASALDDAAFELYRGFKFAA